VPVEERELVVRDVERVAVERRVPVEREPVEREPVERAPVERVDRVPVDRELPEEREPVERALVDREPVERLVEREPVERVPVEREPVPRDFAELLRLVVVRRPDDARDEEPERDVLAGIAGSAERDVLGGIAGSLVPPNSSLAKSGVKLVCSSGVSLGVWGDGVPQPS
jgi:hypothetical protein